MKQDVRSIVQNADEDHTLCRFLQWDSDFFGCNIASVTTEFLDAQQHEQLQLWCEDNAIDCLYLLADPESANLERAQFNGFALRDVRVTLDRKVAPHDSRASTLESVISPYAADDLDELRAIARVSHRDTRFYRDGKFLRQRCDELYATWIEKSCRGGADAVFVARSENRAVGYVTCHLTMRDGVQTGTIGLVGVAAAAQGKGLGRALIETALHWFCEHGAAHVEVVTQGHNVAAQRLYQKCGFATCEVRFWFHKWFR